MGGGTNNSDWALGIGHWALGIRQWAVGSGQWDGRSRIRYPWDCPAIRGDLFVSNRGVRESEFSALLWQISLWHSRSRFAWVLDEAGFGETGLHRKGGYEPTPRRRAQVWNSGIIGENRGK